MYKAETDPKRNLLLMTFQERVEPMKLERLSA
jgi:hypothetical protein